VKMIKHVKMGGLCLTSFCLIAVFALGAAGNASAAPLLFIPHSGKYPYHLVGTGGKSLLETVSGGSVVESEATDVLALILNATLFDLKIEFLKVKESFGSKCKNDGKTEAILVNLLGHLGFADPGNKPAILTLVPGGFEFECLGGFAKIKVRGSVIGEITSPGLGVSSETETVKFVQSKGKQALQTFLLGNETLTGQHEESSIDGGAFGESGQEGEATLKALPGQGTFLLVSP
jgi:hypothetical protein